MISFVVPAHNEQAYLVRTLRAIHDAAHTIGQRYEIIVANDASTDATAEIARENNARVVDVNHRQIAATRNSGARAAKGERIFFVDADTTINARAVVAAIRAMDKGAVGGGGPTWVGKNEPVPLYARMLAIFALIAPKLAGFSGGAFMFCTRQAFEATGGFNERVYFGEEGLFALALRREGRFVGLWEHVLTSGRRVRKISGLELLAGGIRLALSPIKSFTRRSFGEKVWYDSNRADDDKMPDSLGVRISNGLTLIILVVTLSEPLWTRLPRAAHAMGDSAGQGANDHECHSLPRWAGLLGAGAGSIREPAASETLDRNNSINSLDRFFCVERLGSDESGGLVLVMGLAWNNGPIEKR